ncbi:hypothetical protein RvY_13588 [Ramazzottius varieornatus]|uniref:Reverse transcriptase domain-containing protein n=1 Tax=Ramazzottius varieornatus TaxID=947166 RepID=A0A1D1VQ72_RAMVA|nr:hypothetical protein RvY_13588 [Ramazzottius varieornatus]
MCVEIKLQQHCTRGSRRRPTPSDQPKVRTNWTALAQEIVGPLTSSFAAGQYDSLSALLDVAPGMVAQLRRTYSYQPRVSTCDPHPASLRNRLSKSKEAYRNTSDIKARKALAARMRRIVRSLQVNEHLTSLRSLLTSKRHNLGSFWNMFKDPNTENSLPFTVEEITQHLSQMMGQPTEALLVNESVLRLFRTTDNKSCHDRLTLDELMGAIMNIQSKSSSGPDKLPTELYKLLLYHRDYQLLMLACLNEMLCSGTVPAEWLFSKLVTIPKKGKSVSLENLRPISIIALSRRIFMKLVCRRLVLYLPHAAQQFGFTAGKSCSEALLTYSAAIETSLPRGGYCVAVFLDLKAAFGTVNHGPLLSLLELSMTPFPLCKIMKYVYHNSACSVFANGEYGEPSRPTKGVKQGDPASGELCIFYISKLHEYVSQGRQAEITLGGRPVFLVYADDIVILSVSIVHAQLTISRVCEYKKALGLTLNVPKCAVMHISRTKARLQSLPPLFIGNTEVEIVTQFKYLGATVNSSNKYTQTKLPNVPIATAASAMMLRCITQRATCGPVDLGLELFGTFAKSVASTGYIIFNEWLSPGSHLLKRENMNQVFTRFLEGEPRLTTGCIT